MAEHLEIPGYSGLVAVGGQGAVARYRGVLAGREVLVCTIAAGHPEAPAIRARLAAMEGALLELEHPRVQETIEVLNSDVARLVVSWPGEDTLADLCRPGQPAVEPGVAIAHALDLCRGLGALHAAGLVHLGLRPSSVALPGEGLRIIDAGLATGRSGDPPGAEDAVLAPEQILGLPVDIRADLHAVGAILHRLVMGSWPWAIARQEDLDAWARAELPVWPPGELAPGLLAVLRRLLARSPENRYASPAEAIEDLERVGHGFSPIHARVATATRHRLNQVPGTATVDHLRRSPPANQAVVPVPPSAPGARTAPAPRGISPVLLGAGGGAVVVLAGVLVWLGNRPAAAAPIPVPPASASPAKPAGPAWASASGQDAQGRWAEITVGSVVQRLRRLPAGDAWIGSPQDEPGRKDNEDRFQFTLSRDLWCADSEVTQALFLEVMGRNPSQFRGDNLPVENVTWQDATTFCVRLGQRIPGLRVRLPTEAEWEYACRAGGAPPPAAPAGQPVCWDVETSTKVTHPVRRLAANAWGLFDLRGNVMEWTADAMAPYPREAQVDRQVPQGAQRVARGGGWSSGPVDTRPASRFHFMSVAHLSFLGFRFVAE